jgi:hypothetical protein
VIAAEQVLLQRVLRFRIVVDHAYKYVAELGKALPPALRDYALGFVHDCYQTTLAFLLFQPWTLAAAVLLLVGDMAQRDMTAERLEFARRDARVPAACEYLMQQLSH